MNGSVAGVGATHSRGWLLLLFLPLTLVVINGSQALILTRLMASLEEELRLRLETVATASVAAASPELLLELREVPDAVESIVRSDLHTLYERNDLSELFVVDTDGIILFDQDDGSIGELNPFLKLDIEAFARAVAGVPSASELLEAGGSVVRAAYAPVKDRDELVGAVLCVTAGAGFHQRLPALKRTAWAVSIGSTVVIVLLSAIFFGMQRRLSVTEAALARSETLSAMGLMAAGVAHEIRNPLAIITGTAQRLRRKYGGDGRGDDELFDFIPEEVERLNGILNGYLRFARDESLAFAECDLAGLVERCAGLLREQFDGRSVRVTVVGAEEPALLQADAPRLTQVLLNLLLNAAQAMRDGGEITVTVLRTESVAGVRVEDTGPGFEDKALRGAFQPFFTTKEKGSGLGLVVAKRIVEGHGGTIELANREGGGASVTVELPVGGPVTTAGSPRKGRED